LPFASAVAHVTEYQPGVCNIGRDERRKRRVAGVAGFVGAVAYVGVVLWTGLPDRYLLGTFAFLFGGFVGVFQDYFRFCVGFAALARYDLSGSGDEAGTVADAAAVRRDRRRALQILAYAALSAGAVTAVCYAVGTTL
jgi:ferric-dicitrate binding protein FerR (iron transport regulator)